MTVQDRFWSKVDKAGSYWLWLGYLDKDGYGTFSLSHAKAIRAHRYSYALTHGDIPNGLLIRHRCDNPACVRPEHLEAGTQKQNIADMDARGRRPRGFKRPNGTGDKHWMRRHPDRIARGGRHGCAKLNDQSVAIIKKRLSLGETHRSLAAEFGVTRSAIGLIARGKHWKHITPSLDFGEAS